MHAKGPTSFLQGAPENGDRTRALSLHSHTHRVHGCSRSDRVIVAACDTSWVATLAGRAEEGQLVLLRLGERAVGRVALVARSRVHAVVCVSVVHEAGSRPMLAGSEAAEMVVPWVVVLHVLSRHAGLAWPGLGWPLNRVAGR